MKIALGCDHAGFDLKRTLSSILAKEGHEVIDVGATRLDPDDDYPDAAAAVGRAIVRGRAERGILICGSGVGASVAANKIHGVRAGLCHDAYSARQGVEHDDINILCLGARVIGAALAEDLVRGFLGAHFTAGERHTRRLRKTEALEREGR